jgi:exodeoxyribonuclease V beta subunit
MQANAIPADDPSAISLDGHAVIEASAGTGKTYTIENLAVRLIAEGRAALPQILVVTFTEKATSEIRERIRVKLLEALTCAAEPEAARLRGAIAVFDSAHIFTIHGFCQRMLWQYAFENKLLFEPEVSNDPNLYDRLFTDQLRTLWRERYLPSLSQQDRVQARHKKFHRRAIISVAKRQREGDKLEPCPVPAEARLERLIPIFKRLSALIGPVPPEVETGDFCQRYRKLDFARDHSLQIPGLRLEMLMSQVLRPLLEAIHAFESDGELTSATVERLDSWYAGIYYKRFKNEGHFAVLLPPRYRQDGAVPTCPELPALIEILADLDADLALAKPLFESPSLACAVDAIRHLRSRIADHKHEHGLVSFDDLLLRLHEALDPDHNDNAGLLLDTLRERFRYAFVDEFQDTDPTQWAIFERIFVAPDHGLFLIGDPKQAIYSFRGADLHTYQLAVRTLAEQHAARSYFLPTNWRSIPALLDVFNAIFATPTWFGAEHYQPVQAPPEPRNSIHHDETERCPLTIVDLLARGCGTRQAQRRFAEFIACEVRKLLSNKGQHLQISQAGKSRPIQANDICILVRKASEAAPVEAALRDQGLSFSYYKKPGLYSSDEAYQISLLFAAIVQPQDNGGVRKALLTPFFQIDIVELWKTDELPADHPVRRCLLNWEDLAARRHWSRLFRSILDDTGVIYRAARDPDGERRITNYQHILQELHRDARARNLGFEDVVNHLNNCRHGCIDVGEDRDLQRLETERPKVQIMTMHQAKGLEFPVVFVAGGFSDAPSNDYWTFHDGDDRVVHDLGCNSLHADTVKRENRAEEHRLYYVAFTRAIAKLYLPLFRPESSQAKPGAIGTFIYDSLQAAYPQDSSEVSRIHPETLLNAEFANALVPEGETAPELAAQRTSQPLFLPQPFDFSHRRHEVLSFSSLHQHSQPAEPSLRFAETPAKSSDEPASGNIRRSDVLSGASQPLILPRGPSVGSMLHNVLELMDWADAANSATPAELLATPTGPLIDEEMSNERVTNTAASREQLRLAAAELILAALQTPLAPGLILSQIAPADRLAEVGFHYPLPSSTDVNIPDAQWRDGFLTGFIDLVFRIGERYFILDWKSNALDDGYGLDSVVASMDAAEYHLQYRLYTIALRRWLRQRYSDDPFLERFGGAYYLYLRGLAEGGGIFHYRPRDETEIDQWEQDLYTRVNHVH